MPAALLRTPCAFPCVAEALRDAKAHFNDAAVRAFQLGVGIDVFCIGHDDFGTTSLVGLTAPSAGSVYLVEAAAPQADGEGAAAPCMFSADLRACLGLWPWDAGAQGGGSGGAVSGAGWQHDAIIGVQLRVAAPLAVSAVSGAAVWGFGTPPPSPTSRHPAYAACDCVHCVHLVAAHPTGWPSGDGLQSAGVCCVAASR